VITAVVLAAGSSTRMGRAKLLLPLAGKPIVRHVVDAALGAPVDEVVVVLGAGADAVRTALQTGGRVRFTVNERHSEGQSTSLRAGLAAADPAAEAAVILLGDQPGVATASIRAVVEAFRDTGEAGTPEAVQAAYGGRPAHPTLFARVVWDEVVGEGDHGARTWLRKHPGRRLLVEVGGEPPPDVDTPDDYELMRGAFESL
jgi:molybdenum cofactor cytidylyltransferase